MIKASTILQEIQDAKKSHILWVKNAEHLVEKFVGDEDVAALRPTTCDFGHWFYSKGAKLSAVATIGNIMNRIESHHNELHDSYADIYHIYFVLPDERHYLKRVVTLNSQKISLVEREMAKVHLKYLKRSSREILELLSILEKKVKGLEYTELSKIEEE